MLTPQAVTDLTDLFSPIDFTGGALAAVSGGSDSTALLVLLKEYFDRALPSAQLVAATVDHGLRAGSAAEAQAVAALCARLGVPHVTLFWQGAKPAAGLPAAAREARYELLAQAARRAGACIILTGHTADDQAETVLMRQARGGDTGGLDRGLAGMAPATLYDWRVWIVRPVLRHRRADLRAMLRDRGLGWAEDPTNADRRLERPRIRARLAGAGGDALRTEMLAIAAKAARERTSLGVRAAQLVDAHARMASAGLIRLDASFAADADREAALYALRILLSAVGGVPQLPDAARSAELLASLTAGPFRATLSRTMVDARRAGIFLHRESRGLPEPSALMGGMAWDGRFRIECATGAEGLSIAPFGYGKMPDIPSASDVPASLVRAALAAEPAWWRDGERPQLMLKETGAVTAGAIVAPWAHFLPCFDLAPASAVARLIGAPDIPALPLRGHIGGGRLL